MIGKPFEVGNSGRPKGSENKLTKTVKETFQKVFNDLQEDPETNLESFATKYPKEFHQIVAKLIPTDVKATIETENVKVNLIFPKPKGE